MVLVPLLHLTTLTIHLNSSPIELLTLLIYSPKKKTIKRLKERLTRSFVTTS